MKRMVFLTLGVLCSIVPATVATLLYFPLWIEKGAGATVSGLCAFLLILCVLPLFRFLKGKIGTPSLPLMWGLVYVLTRALAGIVDEICVIAFVGFVTNLAGQLFFRLAKKSEVK